MRRVTLWLITILTLALLPFGAAATVITYIPSLLGGNQWRYDFTVAFAVSDPTIDELTKKRVSEKMSAFLTVLTQLRRRVDRIPC